MFRCESRPLVCVSNAAGTKKATLALAKKNRGIDGKAGDAEYTSHNCGKFLKDRAGKLGRVSLIIRICPAEFAPSHPSYDYQVRRSFVPRVYSRAITKLRLGCAGFVPI